MTSKAETEGAATITTSQSFDALDRITRRSFSSTGGGTDETDIFTYDQAGTGFSNGIGRLTSMQDNAGCLTRAYDDRGNLTGETRHYNATQSCATGSAYTTRFTYNGANVLTSMTYPSGASVTYTRSLNEHITNIATKATSSSAAVSLASSITQLPWGPVYGANSFNGDTEGYGFDLDYRMTHLVITNPNQAANQAFGYDNADDITSFTDSAASGTNGTYGYDPINRLTSATGWFGSGFYTLDANANSTIGGSATIASGSNRFATLSGASVGYSNRGNIYPSITPPGASPVAFAYNNANRLKQTATPSVTANYLYDGLGRRFSKASGGSNTFFFYDLDGNVIEEVANATGTATAYDYIYLDSRPIGTLTPSTGTLAYIHVDRMQTPYVVTDAARKVSWMDRFTPTERDAGVTSQAGAASITQDLRFLGHFYDPETGFMHNGARDYSATLQRYIETDPIGLGGGLNTYAYANGNALKYTDKTGQMWNLGNVARALVLSFQLIALQPDNPLDLNSSMVNQAEEFQSGAELFGRCVIDNTARTAASDGAATGAEAAATAFAASRLLNPFVFVSTLFTTVFWASPAY